MPPDQNPSIAQLLEESKAMLRRFELLSGQDHVEELGALLQKQGLDDLGDALEPAADAYFDLYVDDEARSVVAEFRPPAQGGKPLALEAVEAALAQRKVVHGVFWPVIHEALQDCNLSTVLRSGIVIARATEPVPFVPEHFELVERWQKEAVQASQTTGGGDRVDYKEQSPLLMIEAGALIARRVGDCFGSHGTDVLGRELPFPILARTNWIPGDNIVETPVGLEAARDGCLVLEPPHMAVHPVLELEGVDYHTGNVRFRGDIVLRGKISSGFEVEASGGIVATGTLDASKVSAGGDLSTPEGIVGNGDGSVKVGGSVTAKFLEHLYLVAQGDVHAEASILNCVVKTRGRLTLGDKGILAGGQVHALHGAVVHQISTPTGPRTELLLGLDFQGMERIVWFRERRREAQEQLKKVEAAVPYGGERVRELLGAAKKLRTEIAQLTEAMRNQLETLAEDEEASLLVTGVVYPGTTIEICHVQFHVNQKLAAVRFFLDKKRGIIGVETTTPSASTRKKR